MFYFVMIMYFKPFSFRYSEEKSIKPKENKEETLYKFFLKQIIFPQTKVPTKLTSKFVSTMIMSFGEFDTVASKLNKKNFFFILRNPMLIWIGTFGSF